MSIVQLILKPKRIRRQVCYSSQEPGLLVAGQGVISLQCTDKAGPKRKTRRGRRKADVMLILYKAIDLYCANKRGAWRVVRSTIKKVIALYIINIPVP